MFYFLLNQQNIPTNTTLRYILNDFFISEIQTSCNTEMAKQELIWNF